MQQGGIEINTMDMKTVLETAKPAEGIQLGRWPSGYCGRDTGVKLGMGLECHRRCSGLRNLWGMQNFLCRECIEREGGLDNSLEVVGGML